MAVAIGAMFMVGSGGAAAANVTVANGESKTPAAADTVEFTGTDATGTATVSTAITIGAVTNSGTSGAGTLTFSGAVASGGSTVGGVGAVIGVLNAGATGATTSFTGAVYANAINVTGTGTLSLGGDATGTVAFGADGTVSVAVDQKIVGAVTTTGGNNTGTLTFGTTANNTTVASTTVGANGAALKTLTLGAAGGVTATVGGNVFAQTVNISNTAANGTAAFLGDVNGAVKFTAAGTMTVAADKKIVGAVTTTGGNNTGTLTFGTATTDTTVASTTVGASGAALKALTLGAAATKTATVGGDVYAETINISNTAANGTAAFLGNVTGAVKFTAAGTMTVAAGKSITGAVTNTSGAAAGTLTFSGTTTTGGDIGATGANTRLAAINFNDGTATINNNLYATNINIAGTTAAVMGASKSFEGTLSIATGASLDLGTYTLSSGASGNGSGILTFNGNSTLKTTLSSINGTTLSGGNMALGGTGQVNLSGTMPTTTRIVVNVNGVQVADGAKLTLIETQTGSPARVTTLAASQVTDNSATVDFVAKASSDGGTTWAAEGAQGQDLFLVATRVSGGYATAASIASGSTASGAANSLNTLASAGTATGDMKTVLAAFDGYDATQLNSALKKTAPVVNTASTAASFSVASGGLNNVASRLAAVRGDVQMADSGAMTGLSAGNGSYSDHFWVKGFGSWNKANMRDGFDGYKAKSAGLSVGADTEMSNGWTVGGAFTYAATTVDQQDTRVGDGNKIKSYQLAAYAMKDFGPAYLDAMASYALHDNDTKRATALGRTATGSFNADQWSARIGGGYRIPMEGKTQFIPLASLEWSTLKQKAYTETGAGALNLSYNSATTDSLKLGIGARITGETNWGNSVVLPEVHAVAFHDAGDARTDTTANFTGGGAAFTTTGQNIQRNSYNVGASLAVLNGKKSKITLGYDYEGRSGFSGHSAQLTGRWAF